MSKFQEFGLDAEQMYVREDKTLQELANFFGLSIQTLSRWKIAGDWEGKRKKYRGTVRSTIDILEDVLRGKAEELRTMAASAITAEYTDALVKLVASISKLKKEDDIRVQAITVMGEFSKFVKRQGLDDKKLMPITKLIQDFFIYLKDI